MSNWIHEPSADPHIHGDSAGPTSEHLCCCFAPRNRAYAAVLLFIVARAVRVSHSTPLMHAARRVEKIARLSKQLAEMEARSPGFSRTPPFVVPQLDFASSMLGFGQTELKRLQGTRWQLPTVHFHGKMLDLGSEAHSELPPLAPSTEDMLICETIIEQRCLVFTYQDAPCLGCRKQMRANQVCSSCIAVAAVKRAKDRLSSLLASVGANTPWTR